MDAERKGRVVAVCTSESRDYPKYPRLIVAVNEFGLHGDAHGGPTRPSHREPGVIKPNDRGISIVAQEVRGKINWELGLTMQPGDFNENLLIGGLGDLSDLEPGDELHFQHGVVVRVHEQNKPCAKLNRYNDPGEKRVSKAIVRKEDGKTINQRGVVAFPVVTGFLFAGEEVTLRKLPKE